MPQTDHTPSNLSSIVGDSATQCDNLESYLGSLLYFNPVTITNKERSFGNRGKCVLHDEI